MSDIVEVIHGTVINSDDRRADRVNELNQLFLDAIDGGLEIAYECGIELIGIKESLRYGDWMPWVKANCRFTIHRAEEYIKLAKEDSTRGSNLSKGHVYTKSTRIVSRTEAEERERDCRKGLVS